MTSPGRGGGFYTNTVPEFVPDLLPGTLPRSLPAA
jgi:hypothetical protein